MASDSDKLRLPEPDAPSSFEELQPGHPATMARLQHLVGSAPNTLGQVLPATVPRLTVLCRTAQQAEALLRLPPGRGSHGMGKSLEMFTEKHGNIEKQ